MAIDLAKLQIANSIKCYWLDDETNIFKNYFDAIFGFIGLVVIPAISLVAVMLIPDANWSNYTFPIFSICFAGLYDTYGRYEVGAKKNVKLAVRAMVDLTSFIFACLFTQSTCMMLRAIPSVLLVVCGVGLLSEATRRVKTAILISKWAILEEEDDDSVVQSKET